MTPNDLDRARERQLDRLAKLVALESSPNAHEAESARRSAERLMRRHGLRREDVAGREPSGYCERPMGSRGFSQGWRLLLVTAAARHCGCEAVVLVVGRRKKVRICGDRADVERAARLYEDLLAAVLELGRGYSISAKNITPRMKIEAVCLGARECVRSHRLGASTGVVIRLERRSRAAAPDSPPPGESPRPPAPPRSLARTKRDRSDRARARYEPEVGAVEVDARAEEWLRAGLEAALARVRVDEAGQVTVSVSTKEEVP